MNYRKSFRIAPDSRVRLKDLDPRFADEHEDKKSALAKVGKLQERMDALQFRLYAEQKRSLLICLQAPDAGGKDGVVRHVIGSMNPQGCRVVGFRQRLDDPARRWKISEADYSEREYWTRYEAAYETMLRQCSTEEAPWFVIPANHKWFRNLAISQIIVETMEDLGIKVPKPTVNIADIRRKYHETADEQKKTSRKKPGSK